MIKKLVGKRVSLAPVVPEHAEQFATWLNDLEVTVPLGDEAWRTITPGEIRAGIPGSQHTFAIVANDGDTVIGRCLLFAVNQIDRTAMLGIFIGDRDHWNRGLGTEAVELLLDYAFGLLNLNSVMLGTFAFNARAIACYRGVGFREIGRRRSARLIAGTYHDAVLMDILAEEFRGGPVAAQLARASG